MASGKKERIVISCVTFEVAKIVEPAVYYEATKVHLIHSGNGTYRDFYDEVCRRIAEELPRAEIVDHDDKKVTDFNDMMNTVLSILKCEQISEDRPDIYVNISSGTSEYTSAALIASMMMEDVIPFNVSSKEYTVTDDRIKDIYYDGDRPIGLTRSTKCPNAIATYHIDRPEEELVLGLKILSDNTDSPSASNIIPLLSNANLIKCTYDKDRPDQNTVMRYQRMFIEKWLEKGWIRKKTKRSVEITPAGQSILDVFYDSYAITDRK